ncbi:MAG: hypothetical protein EHM33_07965 [Chloroflexi bacterium]|nr:MAG: hypothetical protein EHM33_07965 [Chloroflexota bacterium]
MNILQPTRLTFWRSTFAVSTVAPFLAIRQLLGRANELGVDLSASRPWMGLMVGLGLIGLFSLLLFASTLRLSSGPAWSRYCEWILSLAEFPERVPDKLRWTGVFLLGLALVGFTIVFMFPLIQSLFGTLGWILFLVFWTFNLIGMWGIKMLRRETPWFAAFIAFVLFQSAFHLLLVYWPRVTEYPFAMGWSETSRFYYPSLFLSEKVYGQQYPWPILHPTLHLLLAPPYLFDAPLWVHRAWQVGLRYIFVAAVVPVLVKRLAIQGRATRWLIGLAMFLYLFMGPVYFHLTIPVILVLLGFSPGNDRRTWVAVLLASIWCGWSRVNWYPMPGMIAAVLYLMEVPYQGKNFWSYLLKPALWLITGTLIAFASQRIYVALSGIPDINVFYTSLTSDLLWYRLWPNTSFAPGILYGAVWVSWPMWIAICIALWSHKGDWHPIRLMFIVAALLVVFLGGIIVSLKIGGGANLHNMDAYFILLLIITTWLIFGRYRRENGELAQSVSLHWLLVVALLYSPVATYLQFGIGFNTYDRTGTQTVLASLQEHVDAVNSQDGEILFITQRHLVSMHMLNNVTLVPEYEREDLMEIAMANNVQYLEKFRKDMEAQRFALIVVDPLNYNILAKRRSFAEENNVWVTRIMKSILCNYREEVVFPADEIALYVPQAGERQCP